MVNIIVRGILHRTLSVKLICCFKNISVILTNNKKCFIPLNTTFIIRHQKRGMLVLVCSFVLYDSIQLSHCLIVGTFHFYYKAQSQSYKQDIQLTIICNVDKARVMFLFTMVQYTGWSSFSTPFFFCLCVLNKNKQLLTFVTKVIHLKSKRGPELCLHNKEV